MLCIRHHVISSPINAYITEHCIFCTILKRTCKPIIFRLLLRMSGKVCFLLYSLLIHLTRSWSCNLLSEMVKVWFFFTVRIAWPISTKQQQLPCKKVLGNTFRFLAVVVVTWSSKNSLNSSSVLPVLKPCYSESFVKVSSGFVAIFFSDFIAKYGKMLFQVSHYNATKDIYDTLKVETRAHYFLNYTECESYVRM